MRVPIKRKPNTETRTDFYASVIGRFPEGGWVYMGYKLPKRGIMYQEFFRTSMLETRGKSRLNKLIGRGTSAYICPQVFSYGSRTAENLYALQNMVVDVDMHSERYCKSLRDQKVNCLAHYLLHDADDYGLPEPSWIVFTGRGLQIWWRHESMAANKCLHTWTSILRCFIEIIKQMIADHLEGDPMDTLGGLSVDEQASLNPVGFFRIPGTYNPVSKTYASIVNGVAPDRIHSYKDLVRFRNNYRTSCPIIPRKSRKKVRYQTPGFHWDVSAWAESTALKIEILRDLRNEDLGNESRNNFCLALYSLYRADGMDELTAMEHLHTFNEGFKRPMQDKELDSTLSSARRKRYKYSVNALIKLLDVSEEEASAIGMKYKVGKPKSNRKEEIKERNQKIIHLYITTNMTQQEVGNAVGASRKTVGDVLRSAGINRASRKVDKIRSLNEKGDSIEQISKEVGCSNRTVYRALQNAAGKSAGGAPKTAVTSVSSTSDLATGVIVLELNEMPISTGTFNTFGLFVCIGGSREGETIAPSLGDESTLDDDDTHEGPAFDLSASDKMFPSTHNNGYHTPARNAATHPERTYSPPAHRQRYCLR